MGSLATDEIEAFLRRLGDRYPHPVRQRHLKTLFIVAPFAFPFACSYLTYGALAGIDLNQGQHPDQLARCLLVIKESSIGCH